MDENTAVVTPEENAQQEPVKQEPAKEEKATGTPANPEVEKLKAALNKASADAAEWKRQLREKQTEAERAESERAEAAQRMQEELETLRREKTVGNYVNRALALDFDAETAEKFANALADGDAGALFDSLKTFVDAAVVKANNAALNRQPGLSAGTPPTTNTTVDKDYEDMRRWMGAPPRR